MSDFRTTFKIRKNSLPELLFSSRIFLVGSCFSDVMEARFNRLRIQAQGNPFGVTYNPVSIYRQLERIADQHSFEVNEFKNADDLFFHYDLHRSFSGLDVEKLCEKVNFRLKKTHDFLKSASHVFITLGTAWVHELNENGSVVNNCHKQPASLFQKRLLSADEILSALRNTVSTLKHMNPAVQIIFTLSPVRHLKDGFEENSLSKALLRWSIGEMSGETGCHYFPSYEIMTDDLRDYRFYAEDMLHPNETAMEYIWKALVEASMSNSTQVQLQKLEEVIRALEHRPFEEKSKAHQRFLRQLIGKIQNLMKENSDINLSEEINRLKRRLSAE